MNKEKYLSLYLNEVQVKSPTRVYRVKWLDRSVAVFFAVSFLALLMKDAGEALAEYFLK